MVPCFVACAVILSFVPQTTSGIPPLGSPPLPQIDSTAATSGANPGAGSLGSHHRGRAAPPAPPDGNDVQVNSSSTASQCETVIAADRSNRLHLVGGAMDDRAGPLNDAFYATFDGGFTWSELFFPFPAGITWAGDPAAAIGPSGETYFGVLGIDTTKAGGGVYVGRSFDGGVTVPTWIAVDPPSSVMSDDRENLATDIGPGILAGAVYAAWTASTHVNPKYSIFVSASFDGGQTWSPRKKLANTDYCVCAFPAVGPQSELYVAYFDFADNTIRVDESPDGGVTWRGDVTVAHANFLSKIPNTSCRGNSAPLMKVDTSGGPYNGTVYVCWADALTTGVPDVLMSKSNDSGATWSTPVAVSDVTTNSQFMPWVDVDANGNVMFGFYDRRDDPNDVKINYYVSRSSDGGATFQPNVRVSDQPFNPNRYSQGTFIGDFTGIAASDRTVHALWTDGRNGDNDVFTSRVQLDLHTDVASISAATGGTANFTLNPGPLYPFADYRILGTNSGTTPGLDFGPVNLPLNFDAFMLATILDANSSVLPGFTGTLDASGSAVAAMVSGPLPPALVGLQLDFAAFVKVGKTVRWASNPTHVVIVP